MKAILHIGMHKTGTSSIQASFARKPPPSSHYFHHIGTNLNGWARLMFADDTSVRELKTLRDATPDQIQDRRLAIQAQSDETFASAQSDTIIFSAEYFTYLEADEVHKLKNWMSSRFDQIEVYAYIRDPLPFVRSSYQQRLKAMAKAQNFLPDMPNYQYRFRKFELAFGTDHMHYRLFRRNLLTDQNVVTDFADWIGLSYDTADILTENESLSAEALAFLVAARTGYRPNSDLPLDRTENSPIVGRLLEHSGQKWSLTSTVQARIIEDIAKDCDWMDTRLDAPLHRSEGTEGYAIADPMDFIPLALNTFAEMRAFILKELPLPKTRAALLADLDKLRKIKNRITA